MDTLHIKVFVDVIALLSGNPLGQSVHMFDDSGLGSRGQGTHNLASAVLPAQLIKWTINAIDVQTQVWIKDIRFGSISSDVAQSHGHLENELNSDFVTPNEVPIWGKNFEAYVPLNVSNESTYSYHVDLAFSENCKRIVTVDGPSLYVSRNISAL